jgi:hypothetical protein
MKSLPGRYWYEVDIFRPCPYQVCIGTRLVLPQVIPVWWVLRYWDEHELVYSGSSLNPKPNTNTRLY